MNTRTADEVRALRRLGVDRQKPFGTANEAADAALQIRMARTRKGISQTDLAGRMGISQQQVQRLEDPDKSNPTVATLRAVATALGVRLSLRFDELSEPEGQRSRTRE